MKNKGRLFIISGTSQVGKSAVAKKIISLGKLNIANIKTNTTRPRRPEDARTNQYKFHTVDNFKKLIKDQALLEWAMVHGHYYGTPKNEVMNTLKKGINAILVIDVQGAKQIKKMMPEAIAIFITVDSIHELKRRIISSPNIPASQKDARWQSAKKELKAMKYYDYIVLNRWGKLPETVKKVANIIRKHGSQGLD